MHQLRTFNYVASELGHDEPVLHAVVVTHRCLPPDPPEEHFTSTIPHTVTSASRKLSSAEASVGVDVTVESTAAVTSKETLAVPLEVALTVEQELANLDNKLASWKEQRLADLQTPGSVRASSSSFQMEVAMEKRLARKRIEEQDRAQHRMNLLLTSLGPRIDRQLQLMTREHDSEQASASSSAKVAATSDVNDSAGTSRSTTTATTLPPPSPRARILCDQQYVVTRQEIVLEERVTRQTLLRNLWDVRRLTHLVEDEVLFRRSIETREGMWRDRLDGESDASVEVDCV
ncbi:hypothetical protein, conserved [Leishmania lindenbergi]|uniref:Uncharacterized protein n=1 Tax=Leishmania lindenbergi TaxID=651832 RepID=A0AAW2ZXD3_9TRYP